jgi:membrane protein
MPAEPTVDPAEPTVDKDAEVSADDATPRPLPRKIRDLKIRTWRGVLWRSAKGYLDDDCGDYAAAMTYNGILAVVPSLIVVVALVNLVSDSTNAVNAVLGILRDLGVDAITGNSGLRSTIDSLLLQDSSAKALLSFGLLGALWSASGYVSAFTRASNHIYSVPEGRSWWRLRALQVLLSAVVLILLAAAATGLVISGPLVDAVGNALHAGQTARTAWSLGRWPVLVAIGVVVLSLLFWIAPNVKQPRFRWLTVGGFVSLVVWTIVSFGFGLYVANIGSYDRTYGSLGAIVAFIVWLYLSNSALLLGVEVNAEVQRGRLLQAGDEVPGAPLAPRAV